MATVLRPPRLSDDPQVAVKELGEYVWDLYAAFAVETDVIAELAAARARLAAIAALGELTQAISATPTQAEVQAIQAKINAVIAAAGAT